MNVLIVDIRAEKFKEKLTPLFPALTIHAADTEEAVGDFIEKAEVLMAIRVSDGLLQKAINLKWIQSLITGVDPFLKLPSLKKEILLTSTRGVHGPQMSEMAFMFMIALSRDFPRNIRNQAKKAWERWPGKLLDNKNVGILGVGAIGKELARKCKAFNMTVFGITKTKREIPHVDHAFGPEGLAEVMRESDYFINIAPSTPETHKMIDAKALSVMKPHAFFINIGRGDTVDEDALIKVLKAKKIAGAALDTVTVEPLPENSPLWEMENVIITPHVGGNTDRFVDQIVPIFIENYRRYRDGEKRDLINLIER